MNEMFYELDREEDLSNLQSNPKKAVKVDTALRNWDAYGKVASSEEKRNPNWIYGESPIDIEYFEKNKASLTEQQRQAFEMFKVLEDYRASARINQKKLELKALSELASKKNRTNSDNEVIVSKWNAIGGLQDKNTPPFETLYQYTGSHDINRYIDNVIKPVTDILNRDPKDFHKYIGMSDEKLREEYKRELEEKQAVDDLQKVRGKQALTFGELGVESNETYTPIKTEVKINEDEFNKWKIEKTIGLDRFTLENALGEENPQVWTMASYLVRSADISKNASNVNPMAYDAVLSGQEIKARERFSEEAVNNVIEACSTMNEDGFKSYDLEKLSNIARVAYAMNPSITGFWEQLAKKSSGALSDTIQNVGGGLGLVADWFKDKKISDLYIEAERKGGIEKFLSDEESFQNAINDYFPDIAEISVEEKKDMLRNIYKWGKEIKQHQDAFKTLIQSIDNKYEKLGGISDAITDGVAMWVRMAPNFALSAIPVAGVPLSVGWMYLDQMYALKEEMVDTGFTEEEARRYSLVGGGLMTAIEFMQFKTLKGVPVVGSQLFDYFGGKVGLRKIIAKETKKALIERGKATITEIAEEALQGVVQEATIQVGQKISGVELKSFQESLDDFTSQFKDMWGAMIVTTNIGGTLQGAKIGIDAYQTYDAKKLGHHAQISLMSQKTSEIIGEALNEAKINPKDVNDYLKALHENDVKAQKEILEKYGKDKDAVKKTLDEIKDILEKDKNDKVKIVREDIFGEDEASDEDSIDRQSRDLKEQHKRTEEERKKFTEESQKLIDAFINAYGGKGNVIFKGSTDELTDQEKQALETDFKKKGLWDYSKTFKENTNGLNGFHMGNKMYIVGDHLSSPSETLKILKHEKTHWAVSDIRGSEQFKTFLEAIVESYGGINVLKRAYAEEYILHAYWDINKTDEENARELAEETLCRVAEKVLGEHELNEKEKTIWEKTKSFFKEFFEMPNVMSDEFIATQIRHIWDRDWRELPNWEEIYKKKAEENNNEVRLSINPDYRDEEAQRQYDEVVAKYKDTDQWLKAPNGKDTNLTERQWVMVRTQNFKNWFGDWENDPENASKVVDENGEPLVVYHGTDAEFTEFDRTRTRANMDIQGNFFSPYEIDAQGYGGNVRAFFLNIKNPADSGVGYASLKKYQGQNEAGVKAREYLIAKGFDGVNNDNEEYIAFNSNQIKSATDNIGTFDATNPDIRFSFTDTRSYEEKAELNAKFKDLYEQYKDGDKEAYEEALKLVVEEAERKGYAVKVYHGTGADGFNIAKADSSEQQNGEGNQAHGAGLYVAVSRDTAKRYRNAFSETRTIGVKDLNNQQLLEKLKKDVGYSNVDDLKNDLKIGLKVVFPYTSDEAVVELANKLIEVREEYIKGIEDFIKEIELTKAKSYYTDTVETKERRIKEAQKSIDGFVAQIKEAEKEIENIKSYASRPQLVRKLQKHQYVQSGYLFDWLTNLNKDNTLDEQLPFSKQSKGVQEKIVNAMFELKKGGALTIDILEKMLRQNHKNRKGGDIYDFFVAEIGKLKASQHLLKHGIKGITYDGRQDGRCYVSFEGGSAVKLQDPFTFNDNGELIPLTERFNEENPDMRYSFNERRMASENLDREFEELGWDTEIRFSLATRNRKGDGTRIQLEKFLQSQVDKGEISDDLKKEILDAEQFFAELAEDLKKSSTSLKEWSDFLNPNIVDEDGNKVFTIIVNNGDYKRNIDWSTVCKKRRAFDLVLNLLFRNNALPEIKVPKGLSEKKRKEVFNEMASLRMTQIRKIIKDHGLEVACDLCFVDSKRQIVEAWAMQTSGKWNSVYKRVFGKQDNGYFDFKNFNENENIELTPKQRNTLQQIASKKGNHATCAKVMLANPNSRRMLDYKHIISSEYLDLVKQTPVYRFLMSAGGVNAPKKSHLDVASDSDVLFSNLLGGFDDSKKLEEVRMKAYLEGGVRAQSFSDFIPYLFFDYVQTLAEISAKRLPMHSYTKESDFVMLFGLTGIKINMSLIPKVYGEWKKDKADPNAGLDPNGNLIFADESFDPETAYKLRKLKGYDKNCGIVVIGVGDLQILKLLDDDRIDMVIPYHRSGLNKKARHYMNINGFKDYTNNQMDVYYTRTKTGGIKKTGKVKNADKFDFYKSLQETNDPRKTADEFLKYCDKNGILPRFHEFRDHKNYYKLLFDFRVYDKDGKYAPQEAVKMKFPPKKKTRELLKTALENYDKRIQDIHNALPSIIRTMEADGLIDSVMRNRVEDDIKERASESENQETSNNETPRYSFKPNARESFKTNMGKFIASKMYADNGNYSPSHIKKIVKEKFPDFSDDEVEEIYNDAKQISDLVLNDDAKGTPNISKKTRGLNSYAREYYMTKSLDKMRENALSMGKMMEQVKALLDKYIKQDEINKAKSNNAIPTEEFEAWGVDSIENSVLTGDKNTGVAVVSQISDLVDEWAKENKITDEEQIRSKFLATIKRELELAVRKLEFGKRREDSVRAIKNLSDFRTLDGLKAESEKIIQRLVDAHTKDVDANEKEEQEALRKKLLNDEKIQKLVDKILGLKEKNKADKEKYRAKIKELLDTIKSNREKYKEKDLNRRKAIAELLQRIREIKAEHQKERLIQKIKNKVKSFNLKTPTKVKFARKVDGLAEFFFSEVRKAIGKKKEEVEHILSKLEDIDISKESLTEDETLRICLQQKALYEFGALEDKSLAEVKQAFANIKDYVQGEILKLLEEKQAYLEKVNADANILSGALDASGKKLGEKEDLIFSMAGTPSMYGHKLENIFCGHIKDKTKEAKVKELIKKIEKDLSDASLEERKLSFTWQVELQETLKKIYGSEEKGIRRLSEERKDLEKFSIRGMPMTLGRVIQLVVSFEQESIQKSIEVLQERGVESIKDENERENAEKFLKQFEMLEDMKKVLSDEDRTLVNALKTLYRERLDITNPVIKRMTGIGLLNVDENYMPIFRTTSRSLPLNDAPISFVPSYYNDRIVNYNPLDETQDIVSVFLSRSVKDAHFVAFAEQSYYMVSLFKNKNLNSAMGVHIPKNHVADLLSFTKNILTSSTQKGHNDKAFKVLGAIHSILALGWNPVSAFKQFSSVLTPSLEIGVSQNFKDIFTALCTEDGRKAFSEVINSVYVKSRSAGDINPALYVIMNEFSMGKYGKGVSGVRRFIAKARPFILTTKMDAFAGSLAVTGVYMRELEKARLVHDEATAKDVALKEAMRVFEMTQQSSFTMNMSSSERYHGVFGKLLQMYRKAPQQFLSYELNAFKSVLKNPKDKDAWKQLRNVLFINHILTPVLFNAIGLVANIILGDDFEDMDEEDWMRFIMSGMADVVCGVWFGAVIKGMAMSLLGGSSYGAVDNVIPVSSLARMVFHSTEFMHEFLSGEATWESFGDTLIDIGKSASLVRHTIKGVKNFNEGNGWMKVFKD